MGGPAARLFRARVRRAWDHARHPALNAVRFDYSRGTFDGDFHLTPFSTFNRCTGFACPDESCSA
jgi:hypothetical protein